MSYTILDCDLWVITESNFLASLTIDSQSNVTNQGSVAQTNISRLNVCLNFSDVCAKSIRVKLGWSDLRTIRWT